MRFDSGASSRDGFLATKILFLAQMPKIFLQKNLPVPSMAKPSAAYDAN
jgi:hypothetical protein